MADAWQLALLRSSVQEWDLWYRSKYSEVNADLSGADLRGADLSGVFFFKGAAVSGVFFFKANLSGADLRGANLAGANLNEANLSEANLSGADLRGAHLILAKLRGANLSEADLRGANLAGADLEDANLAGARLSKADLRGARLSGADLRGADLRRAVLILVKLSGANLSGAKLEGADLYGTNLDGAKWDASPPKNITPKPQPSQPPSTINWLSLVETVGEDLLVSAATLASIIGGLDVIERRWREHQAKHQKQGTQTAPPSSQKTPASDKEIIEILLVMDDGSHHTLKRWVSDPDALRAYIDAFSDPTSKVKPLQVVFRKREGRALTVNVTEGGKDNPQLNVILSYLEADPQ